MSKEKPIKNNRQRNLFRGSVAALTATAVTLLASGCGYSENSSKPNTRLVTSAHWLTDPKGNIVTQSGDHVNMGVELTLQPNNRPGLQAADLTVSPYNGSQPDTRYSRDGYPIVALQPVKSSDGIVFPVTDNPRVRISNSGLPAGEIDIFFTVPLNNPSDTPTVQPPLPVGQEKVFRIDVHGVVNGKRREQVNVANGVAFTRQPNS